MYHEVKITSRKRSTSVQCNTNSKRKKSKLTNSKAHCAQKRNLCVKPPLVSSRPVSLDEQCLLKMWMQNQKNGVYLCRWNYHPYITFGEPGLAMISKPAFHILCTFCILYCILEIRGTRQLTDIGRDFIQTLIIGDLLWQVTVPLFHVDVL